MVNHESQSSPPFSLFCIHFTLTSTFFRVQLAEVFRTYAQNHFASPAHFVEELCGPYAALVLEDVIVTVPVVQQFYEILQHGHVRHQRAVLALLRSIVVHVDTQPVGTASSFKGIHILAGLVPHITHIMTECTDALSNDATQVLNTFLDSKTSLRTAIIKGCKGATSISSPDAPGKGKRAGLAPLGCAVLCHTVCWTGLGCVELG